MEENKLAPALLISSKICFKSSNPKFPQEAKELLSPIITDEDKSVASILKLLLPKIIYPWQGAFVLCWLIQDIT